MAFLGILISEIFLMIANNLLNNGNSEFRVDILTGDSVVKPSASVRVGDDWVRLEERVTYDYSNLPSLLKSCMYTYLSLKTVFGAVILIYTFLFVNYTFTDFFVFSSDSVIISLFSTIFRLLFSKAPCRVCNRKNMKVLLPSTSQNQKAPILTN